MTATILAILGMALATYATRASGLYLMRGVVVKGRLNAALDALPPAILMAVIAPTILTTGPAESIGAILTAVVAFMRVPLVVTVLTGVISVVLLRMFLG
ncbi:MAG: AzlD domain-containing protein [Aestuariivirga sp.]